MSQPFDLDALVADSEGTPFVFTWGGKEFSLPALAALDVERQIEIIEVVETLQTAKSEPAKIVAALKLVVGDVFDELSAARPMSTVAVVRLITAWMEQQGLGKSLPSSDSSASTAPPSKRTSRSPRARKTS